MDATKNPEPLAGGIGAGTLAQAGRLTDTCTLSKTQPNSFVLRPYQESLYVDIWAAIDAGTPRLLIALPTGGGKTVVACAVAAEALKRCMRVLFLTHRREITKQTAAKLFVAGFDAGIIQAGFPPRPGEHVQIASVQTLFMRAIVSSSIDLPRAELIIVDECHHVRARSWRRILDEYPNAIVVGLSATPTRADGRGLGNVFQQIVPCASVAELTRDKWLVPAVVYAPSQPDLKGVRVERGDYVESQLAERMNKPELVGDIVVHILRHRGDRPTVVFATGVQHARALCDELRRNGVMAEHLDASTSAEERDAILAGLASGKVEVVTNCAVLTEGWDCPEVSCLVLARPTKSLSLYRQMAGRALRPAPGKTDALILDHAGAVFQHGFVDDPIEWTLGEDRRAENKAHTARTAFNAPGLATCPECSAVRHQGKPCPVCGWQVRVKAARVETVDADLGLVTRDRHVLPAYAEEVERQKFYRQLLGLARQRGYSIGFAFFKYQEKFGGAKPPWPWKQLPPLEPEPHVISWVKSRQIAFARGKARGTA